MIEELRNQLLDLGCCLLLAKVKRSVMFKRLSQNLGRLIVSINQSLAYKDNRGQKWEEGSTERGRKKEGTSTI